jgi:AP-4 complex subunit epsilon-1
MSLIAEGTGESDEADMLLRQTAIELYVGLLVDKPPAKLPKILLETMAWCLGEYAYLSVNMSLEEILTQLCHWNDMSSKVLANSTRKFLTSAIFKLVAQAGTCPPQAAAVVDQYSRSKDVDLQQRCLEFQNMLTTAPQYLGEILPIDASAEDVDVDVSLSFLDAYCQEALANGARPYSKPEDDDDDDEDYLVDTTVSAFKMTPYAKPDTNVNRSHVIRGMGSGGMASTPGVTPPPGSNMGTTAMGTTSSAADAPQGLALNTRGVANVWGKKAEPAAAAAPPPAAALPASNNNNPYGAPPQRSSFDTASQSQSSSNNPYGTSSGGGFGASSSSSPYGGAFGQAPAPAPIEKTPEQLEKERMAAALFGGMVPGAPPPPPKAAAPAPPAAAPPPPAAAPPVAVAPPVEIDLLDMGFFDDPAPAGGAVSSNSAADDIFGSATTMLAPTAAAPAPAAPPPMMVETASEDEQEAAIVPSAAAAASSAAMVDPFAAEGLWNEDTPLKTFEMQYASSKFEYNGNTMAPLTITTPEFGPQWGSCPATSPVSLTSQKVTTLEAFMKECTSAG